MGKFQKGSGFAFATVPLAKHRPAATPSILENRHCQRPSSGVLPTTKAEINRLDDAGLTLTPIEAERLATSWFYARYSCPRGDGSGEPM